MDKAQTKYLKIFLSLVFAWLVIIAVFNLIADPAAVYGIVEKDGFNKEKTEMMRGGGRTDKAMALASGDYDTIIIGTSRAELGLDPESTAFSGMKAFNTSLAASYIIESLSVVEFAIEHTDVKRIVLTLDFFSFFDKDKGKADFYLSSFSGRHPLLSYLNLISIDEFTRSFDTIKDNLKGKRSQYTKFGFHSFVRKSREIKSNKDELYAYLMESFILSTFSNNTYAKRNIDRLERIIKLSRENDIELYLLISPSGSVWLEHMHLSGVYPAYEEWKREMVRLVEEDERRNPELKPFPLWDFSGYNSITNEYYPASKGDEGADKPMKWYWEPNHYRRTVGTFMLERLFGIEDKNIPADFGVRLGSENIAGHLARIHRDRASYHKEFPMLAPDVANIWEESKPKREELHQKRGKKK